MKSVILLIVFFSFLSVSAQITWIKTYGGPDMEFGYSVCVTGDGGYVITGETNLPGESAPDLYLLKTDSLGETLWTKTYGDMNTAERGMSIQATKDGGYVITGHTHDNIWLLKTDASGETLWAKRYGVGEAIGLSVRETRDGGYIIAGVADRYFVSNTLILKTDSDGESLWAKIYQGTLDDYASSAEETEDGGYIIAAVKNYLLYERGDVWLLKTDPEGETLWTKTYGGIAEDHACSAQETQGGGYIVIGSTRSFSSVEGQSDIWLLRMNSEGETLWTKTYGGSMNDGAYFGQRTSDGGYIITGYTQISKNDGDVYLIKTDSLGNVIWENRFGGPKLDEGQEVKETSDGGYIICGWTDSYGNWSQVYLIKTDSLGNVGIREEQKPYAGNRFSFSVFPDPARSILTVQFNAKIQKQITLDIYNALGSKVWGNNFFDAAKISIDIRTFPAGVYFLKAETGNKTITKKITILR
jgi:hypothetical protein